MVELRLAEQRLGVERTGIRLRQPRRAVQLAARGNQHLVRDIQPEKQGARMSLADRGKVAPGATGHFQHPVPGVDLHVGDHVVTAQQIILAGNVVE